MNNTYQSTTSPFHKLNTNHPLLNHFHSFNPQYYITSLVTDQTQHQQNQTDDESQEQILIPINYNIQTVQIQQPDRPGQYRTIRMISRQTPSVNPTPKQTINQLQTIQNVHQCSICQQSNGQGIQLKCNHHFHKHCIGPWLQISNKCPTCRNHVQ